jgi:hypothetical protein
MFVHQGGGSKEEVRKDGLGTQYSGAGGVTPGRWALQSRNVMQSNEQDGLENNIANQWALGDSRWHHAITAEQPLLWAWALNACVNRGLKIK